MELSKRTSVGFYIIHIFKKINIEIYCEFNENGERGLSFEPQCTLVNLIEPAIFKNRPFTNNTLKILISSHIVEQ